MKIISTHINEVKLKKKLADVIRELYMNRPDVWNKFNPKQQSLVEMLVLVLEHKDAKMSSYFSPSQLGQIKDAIGIDLLNNDLLTAYADLSLLSETYKETDQDSISVSVTPSNSINTLPPNVVCKHFSAGNNHSDNYPFANSANTAICDNQKVPSNYCSYMFSQSVCPMYIPDYQSYLTTSFDHKDSNYTYSVYRARTSDAVVVFTIYDFNSNLINTLQYPVDIISSIPQYEIIEEINSIIREIHTKIHYSQEYKLDSNHPSLEIESVNKASYLATLLN